MKALSDVKWLAILAGVGVAAYLLYKATQVGKVATSAISSGVASLIENLTFGPGIQVAGGLDSQSGVYLGPISSFPAATDSAGNTYLKVNGATYQLGPRDASGNFTAIPVG